MQVYLAFTFISTIALFAVATKTGDFDHHLVKLAEERISENFIWETVYLVGLIFGTTVCGFLVQWWYKRRNLTLSNHNPNHEDSFFQEWLTEMPRAAYLLGSLSSSVLYAAATRVLLNTHNIKLSLGFAINGLCLTFAFGAWGYLLDLVAESPINFLKTIILLIISTAIALIALPFSLLPAAIVFGILQKKFVTMK